MFFILFLLPYLFGFVFTVMGFFLNTIFVDYILYWSYKRKIDQMWS